MLRSNLSAVFWVALIGAALALAIWWIVRKRQDRVWLPVLRVLDLESRKLPELRVVPPPWVSFFCFLIATLVFLGFTAKMREMRMFPEDRRQQRVHIFVDMSPSVSGDGQTFGLAKQVSALWSSFGGESRLSLSTTHDDVVHRPEDAAAVEQLIQSLGLHRAGVRIGSALRNQLQNIGEVDRLLIVSDRDQHSWSGFNWKFIQEETEISFVEAETASGALVTAGRTNVFFSSVQFLSTPMQPTMDWDVELARRGSAVEVEGTLKALFRGTLLASTPIKFSSDRNTLQVRVSWPATQAASLAATAPASEPILWSVEFPGGDALLADNEFRTSLLGLKREVLIVSEPAGEQTLDDPVHSLQVALGVLGFQVKRVDQISQPGPRPEEYPLIILVGGGSRPLDSWCPKSIEDGRINKRWQQNDGKNLATPPRVWLVPFALDADYPSLCGCYHRLLLSEAANATPPSYCGDLTNRQTWTELLPGIGARQVGGDIGVAKAAIAWRGQHTGSELEVLAFTVPLKPTMAYGLTHAVMPALVRDLLQWQKILLPPGLQSGGGWPRVADLTEAILAGKRTEAAALSERMVLSNVPVGESLMNQEMLQVLPPRWLGRSSGAELEAARNARRDSEDPLPWLRVFLVAMVGAAVIEALWRMGIAIRSYWRKKRLRMTNGIAILFFMLLFAYPSDGHAQVIINMVRRDGALPAFSQLAREVAQRTSIEIVTKSATSPLVDEHAMDHPWIWTTDSEIGESGLKPELIAWIKRGGFLIIENSFDSVRLQKLTEKNLGKEGGQWGPIPPDHELMRSFYLLDGLPVCQNSVWQGLMFDGRLAVLAIPYRFLDSVADSTQNGNGSLASASRAVGCAEPPTRERSTRVFINMLMVALATDYKKDQIHLPEILKRLR